MSTMYRREKSEIRILKTHLETQIPNTPLPPNGVLLAANSSAIKAAISGLDKELARLEREERLVAKFTSSNEASANAVRRGGGAIGANDANDAVDDMEYVKMTKEDAKGSKDDADVNVDAAMAIDVDDEKDEEEWEEASPPSSPTTGKHARQEGEGGGGHPSQRGTGESNEKRALRSRCRELASSAVTRIAGANAKANTPFGALGLALHAALVGLTTNGQNDENNANDKDRIFRCTGVPDVDAISQLLQQPNATKEAGSSNGGGGGGGFAPPIRELPRGTLVPPKWEECATMRSKNNGGGGGVICFRYKCGKEVYSINSGHTNDATTVYLALQLLAGSNQEEEEEEEVSVTFGTLPSSTTKDNNNKNNNSDNNNDGLKQLKFPLGKHVNLDGFTAAKTKNGGGLVSPSLFYVSLSDLLLDFHSYFGILLPAMRTQEEEFAVEMKMKMPAENAKGHNMTTLTTMPDIAPATATSRTAVNPFLRANSDNDDNDPLRIMNSQQQQQQRGRRGDFDADLLPGGPQPGGLHDVPPGGGSQVGPNHPMFDRTFGDEDGQYPGYGDDLGGGFGNGGGSFGMPGVGGGMGMRPRFDPYGPPGGPTEPGRGGGQFFPGRGSRLGRGGGRGGRGRGRGGRMPPPGGFGNPNPDHMTPPGGDYFS